MKQTILQLFLLLLLFLCPAFAQQPVQALGSGVQNSSDAAWTSATGSNTRATLISNTATYNTIMVTLVQGTTITGGVVTFEQSIDNSTWTPVQGVTLGTTAIMGPTYALVASTNISFLFPVNAPYFSVRLSTVITGSGTVTIQHASQTLPAVGLLAGSETLATGTNVIGHVIDDSGSTTAVTGNVATTEADASNVTLGAKADAKNTATDTTAITIMQVLKEISAMEQAPASRAVTQATGTNLHAVLDTTSTTTVTQATATNLKAAVSGNAGGAFDAATGAAPPANAVLAGGLTSGATGGFVTAIPVCDSYFPINIVTATTTLAVTGVSGRQVRICSINILTAGANNVGIVEGTGATCATGTTAVVGTTAATGYNFTANTGIALGSGIGTVMRTSTTGDSVCIITSAAVQLSGGISYAIY